MIKVLRVEKWPEDDRRAWAAAFQDDNPFDSGAAAHWRPSTRRTVASGYGRWIAWLELEEPDALLSSPATRITPDRMSRFIADLENEITPNGVANYVKHLFDAIRVMAPDEDWSWLRSLKAALEKKRTPKRKRHRTPEPLALLEMGLTLMNDADLVTPGKFDLLRYRDGLIIALLSLVPLRRLNLANMALDENLVKVGDTWFLVFEPPETKTEVSLEFEWPDCLRRPLDTYLMEVRPRFRKAIEQHGVWPSWKGGPLGYSAIYRLICRRTREHFGYVVTPHLFRDAAATNLALHDPANVMTARDLLGHESVETTQGNYIIAQSVEASHRLAAAVAGQRERLSEAQRRGELKE